MNFNNYHYIATIAKYQSISKAAQELYLSQPYLSKFLRNLEEQYHATFFDRSIHPIILTPAGQYYLEYAKKIVTLEKELNGSLKDITSGDIGTLTIGIPPSTGAWLLPYILPDFMQKYPGIKISLTEKNSSECIQLLQEGTLELCFLTRQEYPVDITYEFLLHQKILLAIPPGHPIIERLVPGGLYSILPDSDIHRLNKEPFFLLPEYLHMGALTRDFLHSYNVTPNIVMETTSVQTAYRLTAQKMGFSFVSEITLKNVQFRTPPILAQLGSVGLSRFLVAAYRKDVYLPSATSWLIKRAKEVGQSFPIAPYDGIYG